VVYKRQWHRISTCIKFFFTIYWPGNDGNHWYWYCWMTIDRLCVLLSYCVVLLCKDTFSIFFFTYKNKLKLQRNGSKKIKVRFTVYIRPCNLVYSCIRSLGLLDEWACHSCKNALCVAEATINIATVPFCSLIPIQN